MNSPYADVKQAALQVLLSQANKRRYSKKSLVIHAGEDAHSIYYILKGSVAVYIEDEQGREMIISYLNQGEFFGELGLFDEICRRSAWVRAKSDCELAGWYAGAYYSSGNCTISWLFKRNGRTCFKRFRRERFS